MPTIVNTSQANCGTSTNLDNVYLYSLADVEGSSTPDVGKIIIGNGTEWVTIDTASFQAVTQFVDYIASAIIANTTVSGAFVDANNPLSNITTGIILSGAGTATDPLDFDSLNIPLI